LDESFKGGSMAKKLDSKKELISFEEMIISSSIQMRVEKGLINLEEVFEKLKVVQQDYNKSQA